MKISLYLFKTICFILRHTKAYRYETFSTVSNREFNTKTKQLEIHIKKIEHCNTAT